MSRCASAGQAPEVPYTALYCYAWDLAERGVPAVADALRARHVDTITLAASYHAGKFLRPHGARGKVYFPEDGTVYFRPDASRYGAIEPVVNSLLDERDVLREVCECDAVSANAWLVLMHNTRLGERYPEATVHNAFGDRYVYSLCPAAPAVREYALALCEDVTTSYPVTGISLESPGFLPYAHGFHHEFSLVRHNAWLDAMLGLCFCEHCVAGAGSQGVDAEGLAARLRESIERYLASDLDHPDDMAGAFWHADTLLDADLGAFLRWRCDTVTSLVGAIRAVVRDDATVAVIPTVARPSAGAWYEGSDLRALAASAGVLEACFYESGVDRIRCDVADVRRRVGDAGRLRGVLRPGHPDLTSRDAVIGAVAALDAAGIDEIGFYNYGHLRQASLDWMGDALAARAR